MHIESLGKTKYTQYELNTQHSNENTTPSMKALDAYDECHKLSPSSIKDLYRGSGPETFRYYFQEVEITLFHLPKPTKHHLVSMF
jgi:hypothetical protein